MQAAILLPGPSLANLTAPPEAELIIGAKRAATKYAVDWLVILDSPDLQAHWMNDVIGLPFLLTRAAYRPKWTKLLGESCEKLGELYPIGTGAKDWTSYASSACLVLAAFHGATQIKAYGADFGEGPSLTEFDGFVSPEADYSPRRWARELECWNTTANLIGIEVTRHGLAR